MNDIAKKLRSIVGNIGVRNPREYDARVTCADLIEAADEIERLRDLFCVDGEQHAAFVRNLTHRHAARLEKYADEFKRQRETAAWMARFILEHAPATCETDDWDEALERGRALVEVGLVQRNSPNLDHDKVEPYDPTTQPFDQPFRHVETRSRIKSKYARPRIKPKGAVDE